MEMKDFFLPRELDLLYAINGCHSDFMDHVMWVYSDMYIWIPVAMALIFVIVYRKSWKEWLPVLLFISLLVALCDQVSANIIKPMIARPRPTDYPGVMEHIRTIFPRGIGEGSMSYGFISSHSTHVFSLAMFTTLLFRNRLYTCIAFIWALIMGYSRIYLAAHFVSDVLGGMAAGLAVAMLTYMLYRLTLRIIPEKYGFRQPSYAGNLVIFFSAGIIVYILLFSVTSRQLFGILT